MFAYKKKVVPLQRQTKNDSVHVTLGYGVMVTQQILVLFFLVRIQVAQQRRSLRRSFFVSIRFSVRISEIISLSVIENSFVDNQKLSRQ